VVSREEAVMRIKAAIDARKESGSDIVIVARTDSRQAVSLDESLWRCRAFADVGADVLFIDALASKEEMKAFCEISPLVPKMVYYAFLIMVLSNRHLMLSEGCDFPQFFF
jgi:2-methylisocitrate lyase-like PEP mutase family enzyme